MYYVLFEYAVRSVACMSARLSISIYRVPIICINIILRYIPHGTELGMHYMYMYMQILRYKVNFTSLGLYGYLCICTQCHVIYTSPVPHPRSNPAHSNIPARSKLETQSTDSDRPRLGLGCCSRVHLHAQGIYVAQDAGNDKLTNWEETREWLDVTSHQGCLQLPIYTGWGLSCTWNFVVICHWRVPCLIQMFDMAMINGYSMRIVSSTLHLFLPGIWFDFFFSHLSMQIQPLPPGEIFKYRHGFYIPGVHTKYRRCDFRFVVGRLETNLAYLYMKGSTSKRSFSVTGFYITGLVFV